MRQVSKAETSVAMLVGLVTLEVAAYVVIQVALTCLPGVVTVRCARAASSNMAVSL